jgi:hypothetical protein
MAENLVIIGRELERLLSLCTEISGSFRTTTVMERQAIVEASALYARRDRFQVVVFVEERDSGRLLSILDGFLRLPIVLLPPGSETARESLSRRLPVLSEDDSAAVILATIHACARPSTETRSYGRE